MGKRYIFLLIAGLLYSTVPVFAQFYNQQPEYLKANIVWAFGDHGGLNFNTHIAFTTAINSQEQSAAVSDPATGQLLFYFGFGDTPAPGGGKCWDRNNQLMPNGDGLAAIAGMGTTAQGCCIVPIIDSPGKYYLFALNFQGTTPALYYSVVDMSLNGGLGDIVAGRKNILLDGSSLSECMVAVPGNSCDIWLLVHAQVGPTFKSFHITRSGIDTVPVISTAGTPAPRLDMRNYTVSLMTVSPDRTMLALGVNNPSPNFSAPLTPDRHITGAHLFKFDANTGLVSDAIRVNAFGVCYGVSFSPDNSKLYTWTRSFPWAPPVFEGIRQYDVSAYDSATIVSSAYDLQTAGVNNNITSLFLYNDTIYATSATNPFLDRINNPNLSGAACNYQHAIVPLTQGAICWTGLPTGVVYTLPPDTAFGTPLDTLICGKWDSLSLQGAPGYASYEWSDGATGMINNIKDYGTYWVHSGDACNWRIDTFIVRGADVQFQLGNDTVICNASDYLTLNVPVKGATYLWQDGSKESTYTAKGSGTYWVQVSKDGCMASDTEKIVLSDLRQNLGKDKDLCPDELIQTVLQANAPAGSTVLWNDGSTAPTLAVKDSGTYWVAVHDAYCSGADTIHIAEQFCDCFFEVPSAFTPNGDGKNDVFRPVIERGCSVNNYLLRIYNRWGGLVFTSTDYKKGWDGMIGDTPGTLGVYMYEVWFSGGTRQKAIFQKGDITLIR